MESIPVMSCRSLLTGIPFHIMFALLVVVIAVDVYIPGLPQMAEDLNTTREMIQLSITISIVGSSIMTFFLGSLSDAWGRRPFLLVGQAVYALASFYAAGVSSVQELLAARLIQGTSSCIAMVLVFAIISDTFRDSEARKYYAHATTTLSLGLVAAPLIGGFLCGYFTWRISFIFLGILGTISLISVFFFIPETLPRKQAWLFKNSLAGYGKIITNVRFLGLAIMPAMLLGFKIAFMSVTSFYFVKELGIRPEIYGIYQGIIMLVNALLTTRTAWSLSAFGTHRTLITGMSILGFGAFSLLFACAIIPEPEISIVITFALYGAGLGFSWAVFIGDAMDLYRDQPGTVSSALSIIRGLVVGLSITLVSVVYEDNLLPVSIMIAVIYILSLLLYRKLYVKGENIIIHSA